MAKKQAGSKRNQRVRSPHRGVTIKFRNVRGYELWLARWKDPLTGKFKEVSLTGLGRTTAESRREWAIYKSNEIVGQRAALNPYLAWSAGVPGFDTWAWTAL